MSTARRDDVKLSHSNSPIAPRIGMLVLQRYTAQTSLVRLLENDKCELRAAVLGLLVLALLHLDTRFFRRVSRVPNTSSRTVSYGQKPLPYNTSAKGKLLASGERSSRPSLHLNKSAARG